MSPPRPENVGIVAIDVYFPDRFVSQAPLEVFDGVAAGKYTLGLGQARLGFVADDREDLYSMALTVTQSLMDKANVRPEQVGRIEVGTETIVDHSKSVKSVLMQLFANNADIEGADTIHACYGGTNALFNATNWITSSAWDGRLALVVAVDIAEYAPGPARPTGGAGAVAMLIGPNAPVVLDPVRASYMAHTYDFYKPDPSSPYPIVDGSLSNRCYLSSLDACYVRFQRKWGGRFGAEFDLRQADHVVFHAPYNKLVQKSFARLVFNDFRANQHDKRFASLTGNVDAASWSVAPIDTTYDDVAMARAFQKLSAAEFSRKVVAGSLLPCQVGNMYTASLYAGLASLLADPATAKSSEDQRILLFSYGSGLASSMFSFRIRSEKQAELCDIREALNLETRLKSRHEATPEQFNATLALREALHLAPSYVPKASLEHIPIGAYYLVEKDAKSRRSYARNDGKSSEL